MLKPILFGISTAVVMMACTSGTVKEVSASDSSQVAKPETMPAITPDSTLSGCYSQEYKRDTANLQFEVKGTAVKGPLSYTLYEKDRNDGTFQGEINGDIIMGWYLFRSEGMMSVRQVAWKVSNNQLWPASGQVIMRNDTAVFAQPAQLVYDSTRPFVKIKCII